MKYLILVVIVLIGITVYNFDPFEFKEETKVKNAVRKYVEQIVIVEDSYNELSWGDIKKFDDGFFEVNHEISAKNRMNGTTVEIWRFNISPTFQVINANMVSRY